MSQATGLGRVRPNASVVCRRYTKTNLSARQKFLCGFKQHVRTFTLYNPYKTTSISIHNTTSRLDYGDDTPNTEAATAGRTPHTYDASFAVIYRQVVLGELCNAHQRLLHLVWQQTESPNNRKCGFYVFLVAARVCLCVWLRLSVCVCVVHG